MRKNPSIIFAIKTQRMSKQVLLLIVQRHCHRNTGLQTKLPIRVITKEGLVLPFTNLVLLYPKLNCINLVCEKYFWMEFVLSLLGFRTERVNMEP